MQTYTRFRAADLAILVCIALMLLAIIVPAIAATSGSSRTAVCRNNLKTIGAGLEVWKQHIGPVSALGSGASRPRARFGAVA